MLELQVEQIRNFRLRAHHLDREYQQEDILSMVGACGMQNTPPGAWEAALYHRVPSCTLTEMERLLYEEKSLLQAWSFRGAPVVFPAGESDVFLSAMIPQGEEPWLYTAGISLALDYLRMTFDETLALLMRAMPLLDEKTIVSKAALDQVLADRIEPLLPVEKRQRWKHPSMYGSPDQQTVGGAVVSFLLRPASLRGMVVFGKRDGISPNFTSYQRWLGYPLKSRGQAEKELVRKYLHCYGPATSDMLTAWLGCSRQQGKRLWQSVGEEMEPVTALGKKAFILEEDRAKFLQEDPLQKEWVLLSGHDPYLDQRDRSVLLPDKSRQKQIWMLVSNPGAILYRGEIVGSWTAKKKSKGIEVKLSFWTDQSVPTELFRLVEGYAAFRGQELLKIES